MSHDDENHCTDVTSIFISQVTLYHLLKLFQSDTNAMLGKKTVVSEFYDEMVRGFYNENFKSILSCRTLKLLGFFFHFIPLDISRPNSNDAAIINNISPANIRSL